MFKNEIMQINYVGNKLMDFKRKSKHIQFSMEKGNMNRKR